MNNSYPGEINFDLTSVETSQAAQAPAQTPKKKRTLTTKSWPKFSLDNAVVEKTGKTLKGRTWILLSFVSATYENNEVIKSTLLCSKENEAIPVDLTTFKIGDVVQVVGNFKQSKWFKNRIWVDAIDLYIIHITKKV